MHFHDSAKSLTTLLIILRLLRHFYTFKYLTSLTTLLHFPLSPYVSYITNIIYIYIYIYIYICIYLYIYMYIYICIYILYIYIYICVCVCVCVYKYINTYKSIHQSMYIYTFIKMSVMTWSQQN